MLDRDRAVAQFSAGFDAFLRGDVLDLAEGDGAVNGFSPTQYYAERWEDELPPAYIAGYMVARGAATGQASAELDITFARVAQELRGEQLIAAHSDDTPLTRAADRVLGPAISRWSDAHVSAWFSRPHGILGFARERVEPIVARECQLRLEKIAGTHDALVAEAELESDAMHAAIEEEQGRAL